MFFKNKLYNLIFFLYILICLVLLFYHYNKEKFELSKSFSTTSTTTSEKRENVFYLLWNGDRESTYRLCEMLITEGKQVQPIYIPSKANTCSNNVIECDKTLLYKSSGYEKEIMKKIIKKLENNYPEIKKQGLLHPLITIEGQITVAKDDEAFNNHFKEIIKANNFNKLFKNKTIARKFYLISKYSLYNNINIDITLNPVEKKEKDFNTILKNKLQPITQERKSISNNKTATATNYQLDINPNEEYFAQNMRFPLFNTLTTTINNSSFKNILQLTWSCLNPDAKTGKACGKCNKCIQLIENTKKRAFNGLPALIEQETTVEEKNRLNSIYEKSKIKTTNKAEKD